MKHCPRCGLDKPLSEFGRDTSRRDHLTYYCKDCRRELKNRKPYGWRLREVSDEELLAEIRRRGLSFP